jgi:hypothetical protein
VHYFWLQLYYIFQLISGKVEVSKKYKKLILIMLLI